MNGEAQSPIAHIETHIPVDECWMLLSGESLARVALIRPDGAPDIVPMNIRVHERHVYARTASDAKLSALATERRVALEVDGEDAASRWSVVIRGEMIQVTSESEIRQSMVMSLESWTPTVKHYVLRLTPDTVSGRRFSKSASHVDPAYAVPASESAPIEDDRPRADRPNPIPHYGLPANLRHN
jgi:nitroimidazol reductase NimA-like FMN-containing flavoprotein (pyridoxamine 5'-phosphate oxidase superfamily)